MVWTSVMHDSRVRIFVLVSPTPKVPKDVQVTFISYLLNTILRSRRTLFLLRAHASSSAVVVFISFNSIYLSRLFF